MEDTGFTTIEVVSLAIACWGALLSSLLAILKAVEFQRTRFRIDVSPTLTSSEGEGHRVRVQNLSSRPVLLEYWEVLYCSGRWPTRKLEHVSSPADVQDTTIDACSSFTIRFQDEDHFAWSDKFLNGRQIMIRLHFAGGISVLCGLYPLS